MDVSHTAHHGTEHHMNNPGISNALLLKARCRRAPAYSGVLLGARGDMQRWGFRIRSPNTPHVSAVLDTNETVAEKR